MTHNFSRTYLPLSSFFLRAIEARGLVHSGRIPKAQTHQLLSYSIPIDFVIPVLIRPAGWGDCVNGLE